MYDYFKKENRDIDFYNEHIKERLPNKIFDAHTHINLPKHVKKISEETIQGDWALECGLIMTNEDSDYYYNEFFPDKQAKNLMMPWPLFDADTKGNNSYISSLIKEKNKPGLMAIRPEWEAGYIEKEYLKGGFCGFKPYPYFATSIKGADISIFDFMPRNHFALANKLKARVLMHLPKEKRLTDSGNIEEIREIVENYPDIKLILAHLGRCFNLVYLKEGLKKLGDTVPLLYFDTAAVMNPDVLEYAFEKLNENQILFGTDLPIFLWHGRREWSQTQYFNLCRENFSWNEHRYKQEENEYVLFIYEQLKNILDLLYASCNAGQLTNKVFYQNAVNVYMK